MNKHYYNSDNDDEKLFLKWFNLSFCDVKNKEITISISSHHRLHRILVTCNYCQNDFKTFNDRDVRCPSCCWLIECKLKINIFEKLKKNS